jgi:hypothetical protein
MGHSEGCVALRTAIVRVSTLGFQFVHFANLKKQLKNKRSLHERTIPGWKIIGHVGNQIPGLRAVGKQFRRLL